MSNEQRATISYWSGVFMKIALGITGGVLLMLYGDIKDDAMQTRQEFRNAIEDIQQTTKETRNEFRRSIEKIELTTKDMQGTVNDIESRTRIIEFQVKQLEK